MLEFFEKGEKQNRDISKKHSAKKSIKKDLPRGKSFEFFVGYFVPNSTCSKRARVFSSPMLFLKTSVEGPPFSRRPFT